MVRYDRFWVARWVTNTAVSHTIINHTLVGTRMGTQNIVYLQQANRDNHINILLAIYIPAKLMPPIVSE